MEVIKKKMKVDKNYFDPKVDQARKILWQEPAEKWQVSHLFIEKCCQLKKSDKLSLWSAYSHSVILSKENSCISGVKKEADPDFAPPYMLQHRQVW